MLSLLSLIPGFGMVASIAGGVINFILSCRTCMVIIGVVAVFIAGDIRGRHVEKAKWDAADIAYQIAAAKRDAKIKDDLASFAQAESARLKLENQGLQKQIDEIAETARKNPKACVLGADYLKKLEAIK